MTFQEEMEQYDDQWQESEAAAGALSVFTDGTHQAKVTACLVYDDEDRGWQWEIGVQGTDANDGQTKSMRKWHGLPPNEEGFKFVKGDALILGFPEDAPLSKLQSWCAEESAVGLIVEIYVKSKPSKDDPNKTYANLYFNRVLGRGDAAPAGEDFVPAAADDDIPF